MPDHGNVAAAVSANGATRARRRARHEAKRGAVHPFAAFTRARATWTDDTGRSHYIRGSATQSTLCICSSLRRRGEGTLARTRYANGTLVGAADCARRQQQERMREQSGVEGGMARGRRRRPDRKGRRGWMWWRMKGGVGCKVGYGDRARTRACVEQASRFLWGQTLAKGRRTKMMEG